MANQTPVGAIVHYIDAQENEWAGFHWAGIIVSGSSDTNVDILVFYNLNDDFSYRMQVDIEYSETWENGTWHWPTDLR